MAQQEEVYQYMMLVDGGKWIEEIVVKYKLVLRNI